MATARGKLWIGTSGWTYDSWRGPFYPSDVPKKDWLRWYATRFSTTEINGSFYRTPSLEAVRAWHDQTRENFLFAWKASKFITHWKRLSAACANSLELMESRLEVLGPKLGPVLFQLPARFKADGQRLKSFLRMLPKRRHYAFEFRDASWYDAAILDVLREHNVALCWSDHHDAPAPWEVTATHVYIRGHGPTGQYKYRYAKETLERWATDIRRWRHEGRAVYAYFDNDQKSAAPADARQLIELTDAAAGPRFAPASPSNVVQRKKPTSSISEATVMAKQSRALQGGLRKKSVSKAPASKGREDSRAVQVKRQKDARRRQAQEHPAQLAETYREREHDVDRNRKKTRSENSRK